MAALSENLKTHWKITTVNIVSISEEYEKKFFSDFKAKKTDELK